MQFVLASGLVDGTLMGVGSLGLALFLVAWFATEAKPRREVPRGDREEGRRAPKRVRDEPPS